MSVIVYMNKGYTAPPPPLVRGDGGLRSNPIGGFDLKAGAELGRVIVVPAYLFQLRPHAQPSAHGAALCLGVVVIELTRRPVIAGFDLLALDEEKAPRAEVAAHHVRADHLERATGIECAIRHEYAVIAEAIFEPAFLVPPVDGGEHLERPIALELAGSNGRAMKHGLFDQHVRFPLEDHVLSHGNAHRVRPGKDG